MGEFEEAVREVVRDEIARDRAVTIIDGVRHCCRTCKFVINTHEGWNSVVLCGFQRFQREDGKDVFNIMAWSDICGEYRWNEDAPPMRMPEDENV